MSWIRLIYLNGHTENIDVDRLIAQGSYIDVDLRGERSYLKQIDMVYRSRPDRRGQALVRVFGDKGERSPPSRPEPPRAGIGFPDAPAGNWELLGVARYTRGEQDDTIRVGKEQGRFTRVLLRSIAGNVAIERATAKFGNGQTQDLKAHRLIRSGAHMGARDLDGNARFVEEVRIEYRETRRLKDDSARLELWGERAPERSTGPRRDLVLLGQQAVGFGVDRDTIRVNYGEDWYRSARPFRNLVLAAERNDVHMIALEITYINGHVQRLRVDKLIRLGSRLTVDLEGDRSYLKEITMVYRSRPDVRGEAIIKVYGETAEYRGDRWRHGNDERRR